MEVFIKPLNTQAPEGALYIPYVFFLSAYCSIILTGIWQGCIIILHTVFMHLGANFCLMPSLVSVIYYIDQAEIFT